MNLFILFHPQLVVALFSSIAFRSHIRIHIYKLSPNNLRTATTRRMDDLGGCLSTNVLVLGGGGGGGRAGKMDEMQCLKCI